LFPILKISARKKKCEIKDAQLIILEHEDKEEDLLEFVSGITMKRRAKMAGCFVL
jgi:hypothetical protein